MLYIGCMLHIILYHMICYKLVIYDINWLHQHCYWNLMISQ